MDVKISHVVSFSSETPACPADNVLKDSKDHVWKGKASEKQSVVLQLERAVVIGSLAIGNCGSAFVEVLVGRSEWSADQDYKALLPITQFMTPQASREWNAIQTVHMFDTERFNADTAKEKWDRLRIVCTQPYNKTEEYGLSFVKVQDATSSKPKPAPPLDKKESSFGMFKPRTPPLKPSKTDLFEKRKSTGGSEAEASATVSKASAALMSEPTVPKLQRTRHLPAFLTKTAGGATATGSKAAHPATAKVSSPPTTSPEKHDKGEEESKTKSKPKPIREEAPATVLAAPDTKPPAARRIDSSKAELKRKTSSPSESRNAPSSKHERKSDKDVDPSKILSGVVFCLSGFQNPHRGEIRDMACDMGASYRADWDRRCTHLITAFERTPKVHQAKKTGGVIVKKDWIDACKKAGRKVDVAKFEIGSGSGGSGSGSAGSARRRHAAASASSSLVDDDEEEEEEEMSEDDEDDEDAEEPRLRRMDESDEEWTPGDDSSRSRKPRRSPPKRKRRPTRETRTTSSPEMDAGSESEDTDEEMARKLRKTKPVSKPPALTRHSSSKPHIDSLPPLPDFLKGVRVFVYNIDPGSLRKRIVRYVVTYGGQIDDYMSRNTTHVVTEDDWDDNFSDALEDNPSLIFVRPSWLDACHDEQKRVDETKYKVAQRDA